MSEPELPLGSRDLDTNAAATKSPLEPGESRPSLPEDDMKRHGIGESDHIYPEHRDYLMRRHGTLDLNPLPSVDPADPLNWTQTKKNLNLALLSANGLLAIFTASSLIPAFEALSKALHQSVQNITYLTASQIAVHAVAPLVWEPVSNRIGRRPTWLIGALIGVVFNIACAKCMTYGAMMVCRLFTAFGIAPALALGPAVVSEMYFVQERPSKVGIWALFVTLGPPFGPFIMGFVVQRVKYEWIYYILAIVGSHIPQMIIKGAVLIGNIEQANGFLLVAFLLLYPETRYLRKAPPSGSAFKEQYLTFGVDRSPYKSIEFYGALTLFKNTRVILTTASWAITFVFPVVLMTVEIPSIFTPRYGFEPQQIGLQFIGNIIGAALGELCGSPFANFWIRRYIKTQGRQPRPEYRLFSAYGPFALVIVGLIIFGVTLQENGPQNYNVAPVVGVAIANFGNQIVTTILFSYLVDCYPTKSSQVGVCMNLIRSLWAFIGPFWFPKMLSSLGYAGSGGLMAGLVTAFGIIPIVVVQYNGSAWQKDYNTE